jgi:hypothetical protein
MLQPSSSGVMHAYVKERARDGTGTAAAARARLHTRNARTGTHGTGCTCRSFHELVALRRFAERQRVRRAIRRVTCRKTRSSEPSRVFLNTTLSRERPQTLATRPARQAPIRCPGARTRLRALYLNPSFPIYKVHEPTHRALFSPKSWGKHEPRPADNFIKYTEPEASCLALLTATSGRFEHEAGETPVSTKPDQNPRSRLRAKPHFGDA